MGKIMNSFRTELDPKPASFQISYDDVLMSLGSCFSNEIGKKLKDSKFNIAINPFGVLYNPLSIEQSLKMLLSEEEYSARKLTEHNGLWQSFDFHSSFSNVDKHACINKINDSIKNARSQISRLTTLVITFGTAYYYKRNDVVVANCHKFAASDFTRHRMTISEVIDKYYDLLEKLKTELPNLKIILTLSPVKHLKDGFEENQVSKSILRVAIDEICKSISNVHYFPSYEMVIDDLRDYRFYKSDLTHPNKMAVDYIWEKFQSCFFDQNTKSVLLSVIEITKASNHRPFHPDADQHKVFKKTMLAKVLKLQTEFPEMDWDREIEAFDY